MSILLITGPCHKRNAHLTTTMKVNDKFAQEGMCVYIYMNNYDRICMYIQVKKLGPLTFHTFGPD